MTLLDNDQFLAELVKMFQKTRTSGVVSITMKRYDGRTKPKPRKSAAAAEQSVHAHAVDYKCLFRARCKSRKISTVVNSKDVNKFQLAYASVLKANMDGLKKRRANIGKKAATSRAMKAD
ncbi:signal recognition particle 14 kDa protein [Trichuris trichiura]|uniref:Signal recognition particle 14 kDa protein n=1 Tax=Trichuris trichiura TaxID=36087 RepID=A0A077Z113_TRITR|nr:signal recognition particle 14 kDa protein [Trichuris trichiura]